MKLNFTKALTVLFAVSTLVLSSCGSKDNDAQPAIGDNRTGCTLSNVVTDEEETTFEYNSKGYVIQKTDLEYGNEYVTKYTYDNNNRIVKETYSDDGVDDGYSAYTYTNDLISKMEFFYGGDLEYTEAYTYDANKRLKTITDMEGYEMTFTYNNAGNVTKSIVTYLGEMIYRFEYDNYDNKLKPYSVVNGYVNQYEPGKNNAGKVKLFYTMEGEEMLAFESEYTYEYNSKNLPTRITENSDGDKYISNLTYQCD